MKFRSAAAAVAAPLLATLVAGQSRLGFNYDAAGQSEDSFTSLFSTAQGLAGTAGRFASARLFTTIQAGSDAAPISAIPAAIATNTTLLLGLFYPNVDNELAALSAAVAQYGDAFTDLVVGISVGSEDLYRNSPTGIENKSNPGANPSDLLDFISRTRSTIAGTALEGAPVGHVDTWTAWVNGSNADVVAAVDFVGVDAYPYYQFQMTNDIRDAGALFADALGQTRAAAQGKPVWVTETGWPVSGPTSGQAVPGVAEAAQYWQDVGCRQLFDQLDTWWYMLVDGASDEARFRVTDGSTTPLYDLSCA